MSVPRIQQAGEGSVGMRSASVKAPSPVAPRFLPWVWRPLTDGGLLHWCPPRPGRLARSACGLPLRDVAAVQTAAFGAAQCQRCKARAGL